MSKGSARGVTIGTLLSRRRERGAEDDPLLSVTQDKGVIPQDEAGRRNISSADKTTYWRVYPDDIVYNTMRMWQGASARSDYFGIVSPAYTVCCPASGVSSRFLAYALKLPEHIKVFRARSQGMTSDVWNLRFEELARIELQFVPGYAQQERIVNILSSVDDAIEKTQAVIDQVQVVKRGLMQELLTRGLPGRHTRFKQTEIGEIPEEWEVVELASVATVERGKFAYRPRNEPRFYGGEYPFIQTGDVAACDGLITTYSQTLNEEGLAISKLFPSGTIAITIAANIGSTGIAALDVAFPDSLVGIQAGPRIDTRFLELVLRTRKGDLEKLAPESAQKNINLNTLKPLRVPLPGMMEQRQIAESVWSIIKREEDTRQHCDGLKQLKSALMFVLLTGEIRVTPDSAAA